MKTSMGRRLCFALLAITLSNHHAFAAGVVTAATESNLRAALAGGGNVTFAVSGTIILASTLVISNNTVLDGSGHAVTIDGNNSVGVLVVNAGVRFSSVNITIANGRRFGGAGIWNDHGELTVSNCTLVGNNADSGLAFGGAILNYGALHVMGTSFINNRRDPDGAGGAIVSGTYGFPARSMNLTNCTFSGNIGGTIFNEGGEPSFIVNCTIASNDFYGVVNSLSSTGRVTLINTILAGNGALNCSGVWDGGHNISSDGTGNLTNHSSRINTVPLLGTLANNGGPTLTMALLPGSPAIDGGDDDATPSDQRGFDRLYGFAADVGAYEYALPPYSIKGVVVASANQAGIIVSAPGGLPAMPKSDGAFVVRGLTNAGSYQVTVSAPGASFRPQNIITEVGPTNARGLTFFQENCLLKPHIAGGKFGFTFVGQPGQTFQLLKSTNLFSWSPMMTNTIPVSGVSDFEDPAGSGGPFRFYRTVAP